MSNTVTTSLSRAASDESSGRVRKSARRAPAPAGGRRGRATRDRATARPRRAPSSRVSGPRGSSGVVASPRAGGSAKAATARFRARGPRQRGEQRAERAGAATRPNKSRAPARPDGAERRRPGRARAHRLKQRREGAPPPQGGANPVARRNTAGARRAEEPRMATERLFAPGARRGHDTGRPRRRTSARTRRRRNGQGGPPNCARVACCPSSPRPPR